MAASPLRVLVAEDSAVTRVLLQALLDDDPGLDVVAVAVDGEEAVALAERHRPDIILMDIHMPRLDGHEATRVIMQRVPTPIVLMSVSSVDGDGSAFEGIENGALVVVEKPGPGIGPDGNVLGETLINTLKLMSEVSVVHRRGDHKPSRVPTKHRGSVSVVAIGASTGGPSVVRDILVALPADLAAPILVVQHISAGFVPNFVWWMDRTTPFRVQIAESGVVAEAGAVYVGPNGAHLGITRRGRLVLSDEPPRDDFCPSVSWLMESVGEAYGAAALGVVLTGMGRDGASGLAALRKAGGVTIAQDEESCVVFGMAAEAIRLDAAAHVMAPPDIAQLIADSTSRLAPLT